MRRLDPDEFACCLWNAKRQGGSVKEAGEGKEGEVEIVEGEALELED